MNKDNIKSVFESLLFVSGEPLKTADLAELLEIEEEEAGGILLEMQEEHGGEASGIALIRLNDSWQLCSKHENYEYIVKMTHRPRKHQLTDGQMEVLAIVAYKQPVTRSVIDGIRGVNSSHAVNRLLELGLIREAGRLKTPGRPILLATTDDFLRAFGVSDDDDMPVIDPVKAEEFRAEAYTESEMDEDAGDNGNGDAGKPENAVGPAGNADDPAGNTDGPAGNADDPEIEEDAEEITV